MRSLAVLLAATCSTAAAGDVVAQEIATEAAPPAVSVPAEANYEVGPGDVLSLEVFGETDLTLELQVDRDGHVTLPYVGALAVSGKTSDEVALAIDAALRDGYLVAPKVAVRVTEYRSRPVSVVSGVQNAGIYYMTGRMSVLDVIAMAGGSPESSTRARVVRGTPAGQVSYDLDLQAITAGQVEPFYMEPEDQLHVLAPVVVFVTGEVKEEGAVPWAEGMTAYQALSRAGGPTSIARLRGAYVLREGETLRIDLKAVKQGRQADILLMAGDQLVVPESVF